VKQEKGKGMKLSATRKFRVQRDGQKTAQNAKQSYIKMLGIRDVLKVY
jgi:hypothetical protein